MTRFGSGFRVLRRHLRYAGLNPRKLYWILRRTVVLAREGALTGVLQRHVAEEGHYENYASWCVREEFATSSRHDSSPHSPLISVLMPVKDPHLAYLRAAVDSVRAQNYPLWELCVVDDRSADPDVVAYLAALPDTDARIRVARTNVTAGIASATNSALALATGSHCALMDHDDVLAIDALQRTVDAIALYPLAMMLFSDEDRLDEQGRRQAPFFKPAWDAEWIRTTNCVLHLLVLNAEFVRSLGGLAMGVDGAQDWDLVLRASERLAPAQIVHIPHVLYHWRASRGSTAAAIFEKPTVLAAQRTVIERTLARRGESGVAIHTSGGWRIEYALPEPAPLVSVVIPTRDHYRLLKGCIDSLRMCTRYPAVEILVVDNGSQDADACAYLAQLQRDGVATVIPFDRPFNYAAQCNLGVARAHGDVIALVNNDIEAIAPGWLAELVSLAMRPGVALVGATLYYPDGTLQHGGVILGLNGVGDRPWVGTARGFSGPYGRAHAVREVSAVVTACAVVRRDHYLQVGGMNESLAVSCNDLDLSLRFTSIGLRNLVTPFATLTHHESASRGYLDDPSNAAQSQVEEAHLRSLWGMALDDDLLYNPNLSLVGAAYSLAGSPRVGNGARHR